MTSEVQMHGEATKTRDTAHK